MEPLPTFETLLSRIPGSWSHVAKECHISQRALYDLRRGKVPPHRIRRATLHALAQVLMVPVAAVLASLERQAASTSSSSSSSQP